MDWWMVMPNIKGSIARIERDAIVEPILYFSLNPSAFPRKRSATWVHHEAPGTAGSYAQFVKTGDQEITLDILLASHRSGALEYEAHLGVLPEMSYYDLLVMPQADLFLSDNSQFISPPICILTLGPRSWRCTAHDLSITEEEHNFMYVPTLAHVNITFQTCHDSFSGIQNEILTFSRYRANLDNSNTYNLRGDENG